MLITDPPVEIADNLTMLGTNEYPIYLVRSGDEVIMHSASGLDFKVPVLKQIATDGTWKSQNAAVAMGSVALALGLAWPTGVCGDEPSGASRAPVEVRASDSEVTSDRAPEAGARG